MPAAPPAGLTPRWIRHCGGYGTRCLRKHPALLSSSQFKGRHASKFLQPYPSQVQLFKAVARPGPQLVLLRSPPDTGKTSLAPALPELFPEHRIVFCCLARRVNLLEILAEDHESVPPPPDHAVSEWCARARARRDPGDASSPEASFLVLP